jgi:Holliday junction resolvase RusA-like endonuclease
MVRLERDLPPDLAGRVELSAAAGAREGTMADQELFSRPREVRHLPLSASDVPALVVRMPCPPSVNNLYRTAGRRRVRTAEYDAWWEEAGRLGGWRRLTEDARNRLAWEVRLQVWLPARVAARRDPDNLLKAALDLACAMTGLRDNAACLRHVSVEARALDTERERSFATLTIWLV